jgi:hypothetical protein
MKKDFYAICSNKNITVYKMYMDCQCSYRILGLMKHNITVDMEHNNIEETSQYFLTEALVYLIIVTNSVGTLTIHIHFVYCYVFVGTYGIKIFFHHATCAVNFFLWFC